MTLVYTNPVFNLSDFFPTFLTTTKETLVIATTHENHAILLSALNKEPCKLLPVNWEKEFRLFGPLISFKTKILYLHLDYYYTKYNVNHDET